MEGLNMSLDELISKKKNNRRRNQRRSTNNNGRRVSNKISSMSSRSSTNLRRKRDEGSKIMISNLEYKVTEKDLKVSLHSIKKIN